MAGATELPRVSDAVKGLRVLIAGAGMGGLGLALGLCKAGFENVTVYEGAPAIAEVGAALQCAPNATKILQALGVFEELKDVASVNERLSIRRYADDAELGSATFKDIEGRFGSPAWTLHRADLHSALLKGAIASGAKLEINTLVLDVDFEQTRIQVRVGQEEPRWVEGDLIFGADGLKSTVRKTMLDFTGEKDETVATGDAAYRLLIPRANMLGDPELEKLINEPVAHRWIGPDRHIMAYPIRNNQLYNMVILHKDTNAASESWTSRGSKAELLGAFDDFNPRVRKLLSFAPEEGVLEWSLRGHLPLKTWVQGSVALLGDACHPTLPYVAQGAAQALEDGMALSTLLALLPSTSKDDIEKVLELYDGLRKERAYAIVDTATVLKKVLHLPDGAEQEARDQAIANAGRDTGATVKNPDRWADKEFQQMVYAHDTLAETLRAARSAGLC